MISTTQSFTIATESGISAEIPVFRTHPSSEFSPVESPYLSNANNSLDVGCKEDRECRCPHVIIADDDTFQHMYYQMLFQKALVDEASATINVQMCFSGEELLDKLITIISCGCDKLKLVITDYQMGSDKLDGVETSIKVREHGYGGAIVLRTSEVYEDLQAKHGDLDILCEQRIISQLVAKSDLVQSKIIIQTYLRI